MLDKLRGLPPDHSMLDMLSSSFFNTPSNHILQEPQSLLYSPSKNLAMISHNNPHSDLILKPQSQDITKAYLNPNMFLHPMMGNSFDQKQLMMDLHFDKGVSDEMRMMSEDIAYSEDSSNDERGKRGKYKTYSEDEKNQIVNYMMKHGMDKTLEAYSGDTHKLTKRKLKGWLDGVDKVKGVKGRKSNDPGRDEALNTWCTEFVKENGRPPSRKEATKKALELNADPSFMASKGWLDKFSRKYNVEFTPLKILPPRGNKKVKTETNSKMSCVSETADSRNVSPLFPVASSLEAKMGENKMTLDDTTVQGSKGGNTLLNLKNVAFQQPEQVQQQQQETARKSSQNSQISPKRHEGKVEAAGNSAGYQTMNAAANMACPVFNMMDYANGPSFDVQALSYLNNLYNPYSMPQYHANLMSHYQEHLQQLQKMMMRQQQQEGVNFDRL